MINIFKITSAIALAIILSSCIKSDDNFTEVPVDAMAEMKEIFSYIYPSGSGENYVHFTVDIDGIYKSANIELRHKQKNITKVLETYPAGEVPDTFLYTYNDILEVLNLPADSIKINDEFIFSLVLNYANGTKSRNYGGEIVVSVACSPNLAGVYDVISSGTTYYGAGPVVNLPAVVRFTNAGAGKYSIDDSFAGTYQFLHCASYGVCSSRKNILTDNCGTLSGLWQDAWLNKFRITASIDNSTGVITIKWKNPFWDDITSVFTPRR